MDLLDFDGEPMYFDEPVSPEVERLLSEAAEAYGDDEAEERLLLAYFHQPEHLTVLVALYRYFYYRHRYREALITADRAIALTAARLDLPASWKDLREADLGQSVLISMSLTRFLLLALKGSGYLLFRLGDAAEALERFEKVAEIDTSDRLGIGELRAMARTAVTKSMLEGMGRNVRYIKS
jgi:tetratricopeptide (TPR) repeat protein